VNHRVELITQSEYARRRGVAKSAVAKAVSEGRISLIDGKIDPAVADIQWAQNTRARADSGRSTSAPSDAPVAAAGATPDAGSAADPPVVATDDYQALRIRRERAMVEQTERENAKAADRLVDRARAERGAFDSFRELRDRVMASPQRAAPKVIGMADARDIEHVITEELRKAFEGWEARMLERLANKDNA